MVEQGLQILAERCAQARAVLGEAGHHIAAGRLSRLARGGISNGLHMRLDLGPEMIGHLGLEVAHAVYPAAYAPAVGPHLVNGLQKPGGAVAGDGQRHRQAPADQVAETGKPGIEAFLLAQGQRQQHLVPLGGNRPGIRPFRR